MEYTRHAGRRYWIHESRFDRTAGGGLSEALAGIRRAGQGRRLQHDAGDLPPPVRSHGSSFDNSRLEWGSSQFESVLSNRVTVDPRWIAVARISLTQGAFVPVRMKIVALTCALAIEVWGVSAHAAVSSYPVAAVDEVGLTGAPSVGIGVADYSFVNDLGLGFGGTNTDVFDVGESTVLNFAFPLRNVATQPDLIVYAFVGGLGATDDATVQVEASSDGTNFVVVGTFDTSEARNRPQDVWENDFEAVKQFFIEFGAADGVTHIRLTNLAGTSEGFRLDAIEGLHPDVSGTHAFEVRLQRSRVDEWQQFKFRIKNIADPGGASIREIRIINSPNPTARLEQTELSLDGVDGSFICVENCISVCSANCGTTGLIIPFSRHVWSVDGMVEAAPGIGLAPGREASHSPAFGIDTDSIDPFLSGYSFEITFTDGVVQTFDYDADVEKELGSLYEKYLYFSTTPVLSWNRPVDFYEFVSTVPTPSAVPFLSKGAVWLLLFLAIATGIWMMRKIPGRSA